MVRGRVLYEEDTPPRYTTAAEDIEGEHSESQAYSDEYEQSDDWLDDRDSEEIEEEGAAALEQEPQEEFLFDASPDEPAAASAEQLEDDLEDGEQVDGDGSSDGEGAEDGGGSSDGGSGTESAQEGDGPRLDREVRGCREGGVDTEISAHACLRCNKVTLAAMCGYTGCSEGRRSACESAVHSLKPVHTHTHPRSLSPPHPTALCCAVPCRVVGVCATCVYTGAAGCCAEHEPRHAGDLVSNLPEVPAAECAAWPGMAQGGY